MEIDLAFLADAATIDASGKLSEKQIFFADSGVYLQSLGESTIHIRKIVFHDRNR